MSADFQVQITGNLVEDPELRFTPQGKAVVNLRIASTPRHYNKSGDKWEDGDTTFMTCTAWQPQAENIAKSLQRGARVIIIGRLKQKSYETKEGGTRVTFEVDIDEIGPSLRFASAKVNKPERVKAAS